MQKENALSVGLQLRHGQYMKASHCTVEKPEMLYECI